MILDEEVVEGFVLVTLNDIFDDFGRECLEVLLCTRLERYQIVELR